jgi:hypothetical protein
MTPVQHTSEIAAAGDELDDLFHGCALAAFVEQAVELGAWPSSESTRRRAYQLYEQALASRRRNL